MCNQVEERSQGVIRMQPGKMVIHITSLHAFVGDKKKIENRILALPDVMA
jgi:hypothetical protein